MNDEPKGGELYISSLIAPRSSFLTPLVAEASAFI